MRLANLGSIRLSSWSVFFFCRSSSWVRSRIRSSRLSEYFSNFSNIMSIKFTFLARDNWEVSGWIHFMHFMCSIWDWSLTYFPWLRRFRVSWMLWNSGRVQGTSAQHDFMTSITSGGAVPFDTEGLVRGGHLATFLTISEQTSNNFIADWHCDLIIHCRPTFRSHVQHAIWFFASNDLLEDDGEAVHVACLVVYVLIMSNQFRCTPQEIFLESIPRDMKDIVKKKCNFLQETEKWWGHYDAPLASVRRIDSRSCAL